MVIAKDLCFNEGIKDEEIRVIDDAGQIGIMSPTDALKIAKERGLDLIKISPNARPPVCKVTDRGKFCFERNKKEKEAKKKQHTVELKEIRLSVRIDVGDLQTKVGHAQKFISNGNKVKASIRLRGREMQHPELGVEVVRKFADLCNEFAEPEKSVAVDGRQISVVLTKKSTKKSKT